MRPMPKRPLCAALFYSFISMALSMGPASAQDCAGRFLRCIAPENFQLLDVGVLQAVPQRAVKANGAERLRYTVATRGQIKHTRTYVFQSEPLMPLPDAPASKSRLMLEKGQDGKIGDFALSMDNGGRVSMDMDLKKSYLKINYILDF